MVTYMYTLYRECQALNKPQYS